MDKPISNTEPGVEGQLVPSGGVGASDNSSGGGNATGIPDADTAMRPQGNPPPGNVEEDRAKLFPETADMNQPKTSSQGKA